MSFTRKEVFTTRDLEQCNRIRETLTANGIDYQILTTTMTNPGRHHGVPFINMDYAYQYRIMVKRKDFEHAVRALNL